MATAQERLENVQAAIDYIVSGRTSSYSTVDVSLTKLPLDVLFKLEERYEMQAQAESFEPTHNQAQFARGGAESGRSYRVSRAGF